jgi:hypothetical protein
MMMTMIMMTMMMGNIPSFMSLDIIRVGGIKWFASALGLPRASIDVFIIVLLLVVAVGSALVGERI